MLCQIRIGLLLDLGDFVDVLDTHTASTLMPWQRACFLQPSCLFDEVAGRRRVNRKFEASVSVGFEKDSHGDVAIELLGSIVELLAKLSNLNVPLK